MCTDAVAQLFTAASESWGWPQFISLKELNDESKGFLVGDSLCIKAQITGISTVQIIS